MNGLSSSGSGVAGLDPTFGLEKKMLNLAAPRKRSLAGERIALVINRIGRSENFARVLAESLMARTGAAEIIYISKRDISVPPDAEQWAILKNGIGASITLFGGCGSCSTRTFQDAVELELMGVPSVALIAEAVSQGVRVMSRFLRLENYPFIEVGREFPNHGQWSDSQIVQVAELILPGVITRLTRQ